MATVETIILDTMNYMQALHRTATGILYAPAVEAYPPSLDTFNLPFVFTYPGGGKWWIKGGGWAQMERTYRVLFYIQPLGQDDVPSRTVEGVQILQRLINLYADKDNVAQANPPPYQLTFQSAPDGPQHSDDGLGATVTFAGKPYVGGELRIVTRCQWLL